MNRRIKDFKVLFKENGNCQNQQIKNIEKIKSIFLLFSEIKLLLAGCRLTGEIKVDLNKNISNFIFLFFSNY
jgi:hypothetical protein